VFTTIASSAVRSENSTPGRRSFLQSPRGALRGAFSRPASHWVEPTIVLFLAHSLPPGGILPGNDRWKRNRSRSHHESRGGKHCGELSCLWRCGRTKGKQRTVLWAAPGHYLHRPRKPRHTRAAGHALQKLIDECCCK
jgi:hypothetical protein